MRILDRLVALSFLRLFSLSVLATPPLFILGELTDKIDDYLDRGLGLAAIAEGFVYKFPQYFVYSFPIAGLIAAVFTVFGMTNHREVVAAKAGGISFHRLFLPVFLLGTVATLLGLGMADLVPLGQRKAADILGQRAFSRDWRSDFVFQTEGGYTLAARRLTVEDQRLSSLVLSRTADGAEVHIEADRAEWEDGEWWIKNGVYRLFPAEGVEVASHFERLRVDGFDETPTDLLQEVRDPIEMTGEELNRQVRIIDRAGGDSNRLRVHLAQRWAIPVATLVIILFGTPLATSAKRGGAAFGIGISLGSTMLYLFLFKVFGGFGQSGAISAHVAAWTPNALFFLTGLVLLSRVRT